MSFDGPAAAPRAIPSLSDEVDSLDRISELARTHLPAASACVFPVDDRGTLSRAPLGAGETPASDACGEAARGLAARVVEEGAPVLSTAGESGETALLAMPLRAPGEEDAVVAVLVLAGEGADLWAPSSASAERARLIAALASSELARFREQQRRQRAEAMAAAQNRVLQSIGSGASLTETLEVLARQLERLVSGGRCAMFVVDSDGETLTPEAAPSLPSGFSRRFFRVPVADTSSPYATAARERRVVITPRLREDGDWGRFARQVADFGIEACWACPVEGEEGAILGAFSFHHAIARSPSGWEHELIEALGRTTGIAIEHARAERALRESEARFRDLVEASSDYIWEMDEHGVNVYSSPQVERIMGYRPDEVVGMRPTDPMSSDERSRLSRVYQSIIESRKPFHCLENVNIRKDGRAVVLETSGVPIFDEQGRFRGYRGVDRDITERKRLEEQLRISQKMEAVGRLAGGVAHDFNNLLTAINGHVELMALELPGGSPLREDLDEIRQAGERASSLTRQLLAFSRRQVLQPEVLDLNEVVKSVRKMLARLLPEHVDLRLELSGETGPVRVDPGQMEQVLVNLAVNASDAMPSGGDILIRTYEERIDAADLLGKPVDLEPGLYVVLEVQDDGVGMTEDVRSQIFEPFFTTKPKGKGTGLGLSTVYGIVQQSGGAVRVDSSLDDGSTFRIHLPRVTAAIPPAAEEQAEEDQLEGSETVLLVEDERAVRTLVRKALERHGYRVLEAENGAAGLDVAMQHEGEIDILVTDVVMPEMSGPELAAAVLERQPGLPVLFMSGYAEEGIVHQGVLHPDVDLLEKPFSHRDFLRRLRRALERARR